LVQPRPKGRERVDVELLHKRYDAYSDAHGKNQAEGEIAQQQTEQQADKHA
jgi:hypothetical protein